MKIKKFIRKNIISISVNPDISLKEIEEKMENQKIRHVLVMENGKLLGIISDRDVKKFRSLFAETKASKPIDQATLEFKAHQIMTHNPITIHEDIKANEAVTIMLQKKISCLPVLSNENNVVGMITSSDFLKWMVKFLEYME